MFSQIFLTLIRKYLIIKLSLFRKFVKSIEKQMERIALEVNDETAKAWRNTSPKLRAQIGKNIEEMIAYSLSKTREANFELLLQDARREAAANGLTEEILNRLLNEEK